MDKTSNAVSDKTQNVCFFEFETNPVPANPYIGVVKTQDNFQIRYARWEAISKPFKGTVLLLHGRTEFIEKYFETVQDLRMKGFAVLTFDWRGQGGSDRHTANARKGYVESYDEYGLDLNVILNDVMTPSCKPPYFVLGHSMGGLIALYHAKLLSEKISRMVLCAPFIDFVKLPLPKSILKIFCSLLMAIGLGEMFISGGERPENDRDFLDNSLTSDFDRFERNRDLMMNSGDIGLGGPTFAWTRATLKAQYILADPDHFVDMRTPVLMIGAGEDQIASNQKIEMLTTILRCGSLVTIPGARHEIMQEKDHIREQLWAAFCAFIPESSNS